MTSWFGVGVFGDGDFGTATIIDLSGFSAARTGFDASATKLEPRPQFYGAAAPEFVADVKPSFTNRADGFVASLDYVAEADWWVGPVLHFRPAFPEFGSAYYLDQDLPDRETLRLYTARTEQAARLTFKAAMRLSGAAGSLELASRARPDVFPVLRASMAALEHRGMVEMISTQPIGLSSGHIEYGATVLARLGTALRMSRGRLDADAIVSPNVYAVARVRARLELLSAYTFRATFKIGLQAAYGALGGRVIVSYRWSDLTAVGREPIIPWGTVPAPPPDLWTTPPAPAGNWQDK